MAITVPGLGQVNPLRRGRPVKDLESVTERNPAEVDPLSVGMSRDDVEAIWARVQRLYRWGMHPGVALCVRRDGEIVLDRTLGHFSGRGCEDDPDDPGVVLTRDDPFIIASASKSITAMVIHLLDQRGELHVDDRVSDYIPEFGAHGKDVITINHVLSHRAGVPNIPAEAMQLDNIDDTELIMQLLADGEPIWRPGRFIAYHAVSGGFILAELVKRVTGMSIRDYLAKEILEPLDFTWGNYGVAPEDTARIVQDHVAGIPLKPPLSNLFTRLLGMPVDEMARAMNDDRVRTGIIPAGNIVMTANELSKFYELLLQGGTLNGVEIFEPRTIRRAVSEQSYLEIDLSFGVPVRYGMGFMLGARQLGPYGANTQHAFGHLGFSNILGWADPERRISVGLLTSGKPIIGPHVVDWLMIPRQIADAAPRDGLESSRLLLT